MKECIKVGLLGAGTVGSGVLTVLEENTAEIEKKVGVPIHVSKILVRDMKKAKELSTKYQLTDKIEDIVEDPEIDIVVELIGREHPAKEYIAAALEHKKNVVTANKDVLAKYGKELFPLAEENKVDFMFEASVGGGIPIIRPLKSCLAANKVTSVMGLVILASIAFNTRIDLSDVLVEGIDGLDLCDIEHGKELGYAIKLLAIAKNNAEHGISVCVRPTMLPVSHPLAGVNDVFNAIFVTGDAIGDAMFMGRGAGKMPTASAVCGDIIDVARNIIHKSNGRINCTCFDEKHLCSLENMMSPCYIRLHVQDKPGVLAAIAAAFGAQNVSLKNVVQKSKVKGVAELVVITYDVSELNLQMAVQTLKALPIVEKVCSVIRVEDHDLE